MNITKHPLFEEAIESFLRIEKIKESQESLGEATPTAVQLITLKTEELYFNRLFAKCIELMKSE